MNETLYSQLNAGAVAQVPVIGRALLRLTGEDRVRFLNGQITNDVARLRPSEACYAAVLTTKGRVVSDLWVSASEDCLWIDVPAEREGAVVARLEQFLIADDVEIERVGSADGRLVHLLHGTAATAPECGRLVSAHRFGIAGVDCWDAPVGLPFPRVDEETLHLLEIEQAWARWGYEITEQTLPQEVLLERRGISFTKGCYTGQEIVARLKSVGQVTKRLAFLKLMEGEGGAGEVLAVDGTSVGTVTRIARSPRAGGKVALGIVQRRWNVLGQELTSPSGRYAVSAPVRELA